jgi:hypothetical protein
MHQVLLGGGNKIGGIYMHEIKDMHDKLPNEIPELQPFHEKIYCFILDEETQRHVIVHTRNGVFRFKNSLSYWTSYFNRHDCRFEKVYRYKAINLDKLVGYGWDNAIYGEWWAYLESMRITISKSFYKHLNKSEYRHLNMSVKLRKQKSS